MPAPNPSASDPPLTPAGVASRLAALLDRAGLAPPEPVAVATSGGADSLALALLLAAGWPAQVHPLIVDHGLRPGSADEAQQAARWLTAAGLRPTVLAWTGPKPVSGLQAAARQARYALLGNWCRNAGVKMLATAHHSDDQAETVAMRAARRSGPYGLRGMDAVLPLWPGADAPLLVRPLLDVPGAALRDWLARRGQPWIEDPSNRDPRFERVRVRAAGAGLAPLDPSDLRAEAEQLIATAWEWPLGDCLVGYDDAMITGGDEGSRRQLALRDEAHLLAVDHVIRWINGGSARPRRRDLVRFMDETNRSVRRTGTLAGCRLERRNNAVHVVREWQRIASGTENGCWDGRFTVSAPLDGTHWSALGEAGWRALPAAIRETHRTLRHAALATPALWQGGRLVAAPLVHHWLPEGAGAQAALRQMPRFIRSTVLSRAPLPLC